MQAADAAVVDVEAHHQLIAAQRIEALDLHRRHVDLGGAEQLVDYYRRVGPTSLASSLIYPASIFGYEGYLSLLMGQQVPTDFCYVPSDGERETWQRFRDYVRSLATGALPVREAMQLVCDPSWTWPSQRS